MPYGVEGTRGRRRIGGTSDPAYADLGTGAAGRVEGVDAVSFDRHADPAPGSTPILDALRTHEPQSMRRQPPILCDRWGNRWLDWSSGSLVANAGHFGRG